MSGVVAVASAGLVDGPSIVISRFYFFRFTILTQYEFILFYIIRKFILTVFR